MGMGTQVGLCQNGYGDGKSTRDNGNGNDYFFKCAKNSHRSTRRRCSLIKCRNVASLFHEHLPSWIILSAHYAIYQSDGNGNRRKWKQKFGNGTGMGIKCETSCEWL